MLSSQPPEEPLFKEYAVINIEDRKSSRLGFTEEEDDANNENNENSHSPKEATSDDDGTMIAAKETRAVLIVRILFGCVLMLSTIIVAVVVHQYVSSTETTEFEIQYWSDAEKITQSIGGALRTTLAAADSLSSSIVAHKEATNSSFPFVALPKYALRAAKLKALHKSYIASVEFIVTDEQRKDWEAFAAANDQFVTEAWKLQRQDESFQGSLEIFPEIQPQLFTNIPNFTVRPEGSGPYLVSWQRYPIIYEENSGPYNYDLLSFELLAKSRRPVLERKLPFLTGFSTLVDPTEPLDMWMKIAVDYVQQLIPPDENPAEPHLQVIYPIIDTTSSLQLSVEELQQNDNPTTLVGMLSNGFLWRELLRDILPANTEGILVVTETSCGQVFTYQINGETPFYLGNKDFSDASRYAHLESKFALADIIQDSFATPYYHGIPFLDADCPITVRIYPSELNETSHYTNQPMLLTICSVLIFVFAGLLFVAYDVLVERRQTKVVKTAVNASAIVSEMFPKEVRSRLFLETPEESLSEGSDSNKRKIKGGPWVNSSNNHATIHRGSRKPFYLSSECSEGEDASRSVADDGTTATAPVADLYPGKLYDV
jgi:hypothetical protein